MKLYIAIDRWQEYESIMGVFDDKQTAQDYADKYALNAGVVEDYDLNKPDYHED